VLAIVVQTFIAAPAETVWDTLSSRADLVLDALPVHAWPEGRDEQPPRHLSVAFPVGTVRLTLHDVGGGVRVDVRHDGWPESPDAEAQLQGHFAGWLQGLAALGHFVETGEDPRSEVKGERYFISGEIKAPPDAVYKVMADQLDPARSAPRSSHRLLRLPSDGGETVAILRATPRGTHVALAVYGVTDRSSSQRWPQFFENLARALS
jgi:hypothetical protein